MKTRILTLTGMVLLATATMTNAAQHKGLQTSAASSHENITVNGSSANTYQAMSISLEEWIYARESWEQEGTEMLHTNVLQEPAMLEEWVSSRNNWEQEGQSVTAAPMATRIVSLEEWIAGCESWEQEGSCDNTTIAHNGMPGMEEWMAELANWEQK